MDTDELTLTRIAENQSTFRGANENIEAAAGAAEIDREIPFICECSDRSCFEIVRLGADAYAAVRRNARRFFTTPGHESISVQAGASVVVEELPGYVVVEKIGTAGEVAAAEYERKV